MAVLESIPLAFAGGECQISGDEARAMRPTVVDLDEDRSSLSHARREPPTIGATNFFRGTSEYDIERADHGRHHRRPLIARFIDDSDP